ncbi:Protein kinase C signaling pathway involved MAPKK protein [Savitreella phatthalungensis]
MYPSLRPPGRGTPRKGTPSLPTLAIPANASPVPVGEPQADTTVPAAATAIKSSRPAHLQVPSLNKLDMGLSSGSDDTQAPGGVLSSTTSFKDDLMRALGSDIDPPRADNINQSPQTEVPPTLTVAPDGATVTPRPSISLSGSTRSISTTSGQAHNNDGDVHSMDEDAWRAAFAANDVEFVTRLGEGAGGAVWRCRLRSSTASTPSNVLSAGAITPTSSTDSLNLASRRESADSSAQVFAIKSIPADPDPQQQKQLLRELSFNRQCSSPYIAEYYGAWLDERAGVIHIAMELCEGGSLDAIHRRVQSRNGRVSERVLGRIANGVLEGLTYLHSRKIIHRDIKPSNILLSRSGGVKLCDFGVSGELVNSLAGTFTGTSFYMAPERIRGQSYTVTADVWSLGVTLMEVAMNKFPYDTTATPIELLYQICAAAEPPLLLDEPALGVKWSDSFRHFLKVCGERDGNRRPPPARMLEHPWATAIVRKACDMQLWIKQVWS